LDDGGRVAAFERFQKPWQETISTIARLSKGLRVLIDSTGVGDPVVEQLQRMGVGRIEGFKFTSQFSFRNVP
jgi:hypothetical protein